MNEPDEKIIDKIEKLIKLSASDNENEAKAAMMKAQELMAKYEIDRERLSDGKEERPVVSFSSPQFRDDWVKDVAGVIAHNFRCRLIISIGRYKGAGGVFKLRFFGFEEDAEICINIFNYAVKVVRKRFGTLRAIYADAGREFGRNEKMNYTEGFCAGLHLNFEEQKAQSQQFALALVTPPEVNAFVEQIPGLEEAKEREYERKREHDVLRRSGYIDGKTFQNAGDKERLENGY
ncbi:DUF2786 domain-containing protein [Anaerocolumna xylanovorans]|uniref:Uncharacterized protein n=1 Tax=Anaerocolumna xylanovorans DSM 12503 TaxID=1121345 RepID=A0A1M7YC42_9FIRM|nr:DUF2786 domain-containing protein [Anaerocolumna xylanovorans]SHO50139.1 Protein of unknown function [Anaerocolumna xylanovorans DSM 12503]